MEKVYLEAQKREKKGKQAAKSFRNQKMIPAVLYGEGNNEILAVNNSALVKLLHGHSAESTVIVLKITDDKNIREANVLIKEIQHHPVKGDILHVDFNEISLTKSIHVSVPLVAKGEPEGVKLEGGTLEHLLWELKVECLPINIPKDIEVDVSNMKMGDNLTIKDVKIPEGVKLLHEPEQIILSLKRPVEEKPAEAVVEGAEAGPAEPEVLKQKSEEQLAKEAAEKEKEKEKKE